MESQKTNPLDTIASERSPHKQHEQLSSLST
jgi:hypothetical protein